MKRGFLKRLTAAAMSCAMLMGMTTAAAPAKVAAAPDEYHDDWLHVEGDKILDMDGNEVWLTGCNWFGYNVGSQVFDGVWSSNLHNDLRDIADHGFNLLRVPMSTQIILQWKNGEPDPMIKVGEWKNPELTIEGVPGGTVKYSFDVWNQAVEWCRENGIKIMMDIHSAETNAAGHNYPLWYNTDANITTDDWLDALNWFCDYYKDDDTIIAIDLKNEPHGKPEEGKFAKWDESTDENNWKYAAERGAEACLSANPNLLIMVEGIECYPDFDNGADWTTPAVDYAHYGEPSKVFGAWWGANLRGVRKLPLNEKYKSHIVYSPHDYGPLVYKQSWFHLEMEKIKVKDEKTGEEKEVETDKIISYEFDRQSLLDEYWYDTWAYLAEEEISPLLMGEWGGFIDKENDPSGANKHWMELLRDYMIDKHINHTFWCYNWNSADTGGLVFEDMETWDEEKYEFVKPSLWQTEDGQFISLDHQIPVGKNGISLSQYYGGAPIPPNPTETPTEADTEAVSEQDTQAPTEALTYAPTDAPTDASTDAPEAAYGDVDESGEVDILDVIALNKNLLLGEPLTPQGKLNADVDRSGTPDEADALNILKAVVKIITLPV